MVHVDEELYGMALGFVHVTPGLLLDFGRNIVECFGNTACDAPNRIAISPYANGIAYSIFEVSSLEGTDDGLRYAVLANTTITLSVDTLL